MGSEICYFCFGYFIGNYCGYTCKKNISMDRPNRIIDYSPNQPIITTSQPVITASQPQVAQPCVNNLNNEIPEAHTIVI
jgi:hypothetical protein